VVGEFAWYEKNIIALSDLINKNIPIFEIVIMTGDK